MSILRGSLIALVFVLGASSSASPYYGIENPKELKCGAKATTLAKAIVHETGDLTGSNAWAFVERRFPAGMPINDAVSHAEKLGLVCTKRTITAFHASGEYAPIQSLSCKSNEFPLTVCRRITFNWAMEPAITINVKDEKVDRATFDWRM